MTRITAASLLLLFSGLTSAQDITSDLAIVTTVIFSGPAMLISGLVFPLPVSRSSLLCRLGFTNIAVYIASLQAWATGSSNPMVVVDA